MGRLGSHFQAKRVSAPPETPYFPQGRAHRVLGSFEGAFEHLLPRLEDARGAGFSPFTFLAVNDQPPGPREHRLDHRRSKVGAPGRTARKEPPQAGMRAYRSRQRGSADQ
jgi:hypothetical protein